MCLAIPGKIESVTEGDLLTRTGKVSFGQVTKDVNLAYLPEAKVGDYVLVHVGFAISTIAEDEANRIFEYLDQAGEIKEMSEGTG